MHDRCKLNYFSLPVPTERFLITLLAAGALLETVFTNTGSKVGIKLFDEEYLVNFSIALLPNQKPIIAENIAIVSPSQTNVNSSVGVAPRSTSTQNAAILIPQNRKKKA